MFFFIKPSQEKDISNDVMFILQRCPGKPDKTHHLEQPGKTCLVGARLELIQSIHAKLNVGQRLKDKYPRLENRNG